MRFASLALYSSLVVAAASVHISTADVGSSSSALLLSRDIKSQQASTANFAHRSQKHSGRRSGHKKQQQHKQPAHHESNHSNVVATAGGKFSGKGTFFRPNQGSCGAWNTVNDKIVALSADIYQGGSHCFKGVRICHGGKCVGAQVADLCPGCRRTSLDMTPSLFKELAHLDTGVIDIQWSFV